MVEATSLSTSAPSVPATPKPSVEDVLAGGGEMGALMRAKDWRQTPFGPPSNWPQSLRTSVSILLESRFPMVVAWGPEFRFFYNDGYRQILGKTKHPFALGTPGPVIFPEVWDIVGPEFERVRRGESFAVEDWLLPLDRNGYLENCWFTLSYSPIRDETGGVGGLLAVVVETTGRVEGERRLACLRELAQRISDAKSMTDVLATASAVFAKNEMDIPFSLGYLLDVDGQRANLVASSGIPAGERAAPRQIVVGSDGWPLELALQSGHMEVIEDLPTRFGALPGGPHPEHAHTAVMLPLLRAGTARPYGVLVLGVSPRRALDERYRGFFELAAEHVMAGIASAAAYAEEKRRAEALAELDRAKTTFFSNVSHEFRTPLTLMLGPVEDILSGARGPVPDQIRDDLSTAHRSAVRLLKLVNSLLDFTRIEAGRANAKYEPVDLGALTTELASVFESAITRAGIRLAIDCPSLPEAVHVDREMWEKIVLNLMSNALKFTFDGEIAVSLRHRGEVVELSVRDTGIGIAAEEIPRLFERFHRVQGAKSRTHEGTGIGLALAQDLARLHGGAITVESEPGHGSTFRVTVRTGTEHLPKEHVEAPELPARTGVRASAFVDEALRWLPEGGAPNAEPPMTGREPAAPRLANGRVLVVDDNADMRAYALRMLRDAYDVDSATDGVEALERIAERVPDLVISDIMMPRLDGFGLIKELRRNERTRTLPVILLSARAGEESTEEGLQSGADDYLVKPFAARELLARVRTHIELARVRTETHRLKVEAIERERRRLAEIFENAPSVIGVLRGQEHVFEAANPAYLELVGNRELIGKTVRDALPEIEGQGYFELLDRVFATGEPYVGTEARVLLRRSRGEELEERFVNFVYQPLRGADGRVDGILAHGVDVTPQVLARREIDELYRRVNEANASKSQFLAAMSHELRTPLNAILGYADLLLFGVRGPLADVQLADLERIRGASRYLLSLINDILNFTRLEAGQVDFRIATVDLRTLFDRTRAFVAQRIEEKGLEFQWVSPPEGVAIRADEERTQQILLNLLTNAAKFTDRGGVVSADFTFDDTTVHIHVRDTGRGIALDHQARIFDPFVQIDRSVSGEADQGLGLGLAISRDLARRMDGDISVTSTVGVGSTFTLSLPRA
jgi:signal transduction histidine kinase